MKFREWINIDEVRFKGAHRMFNSRHSEIPTIVRKELWNSRIAPDFKRIVSQHNQNRFQPSIDWQLYIRQKISHGEELTPEEDALWQQIQQNQSRATRQMAVEATEPELKPTIDYLSPTLAYNPSQHRSVMDILDNEATRYQWSDKPMMIQVGPLDFDQGTLTKFFSEMFGFNPSSQVRNNADRYAVQQKLAQAGDNNKAVLMAKEGNKYKLIEGFHRAMIALLSAHDDNAGAPRQHVDALKGGQPPHTLDLNQWRKVPIMAYIGQRLAS